MPRIVDRGKYDSLIQFLHSTLRHDGLRIVGAPWISKDSILNYYHIIPRYPESRIQKFRRMVLRADQIVAKVFEPSMIQGFATINVYDAQYLQLLTELASAYEQYNPTVKVGIVQNFDHRRKKKRV